MHYTCAAALLLASSPSVPGFLTAIPPHMTVGQCTQAVRNRPSTGGLPSGREATSTRLYVGGKIFGQEDEPAPPPEGPVKPVIKGAEKDGDEEGEDEEEAEGGDGTEQKPKRRKRRKKYDFSESDWMARAEEEKRLAQELARKFPDIGQVRVDRMGNIIGGVNPFEDTNVKLEDQPHPEDQELPGFEVVQPTLVCYDVITSLALEIDRYQDFPEVAGEISGMDDPADAPWRMEAEKIVREQVEACGLTCDDILWTFHKLEVTVTRGENDGPVEDAAYVDSDKLMQAIKGVNSALEEREEELFVLGRHELIVATPGAKDILTTDKEFKAFKGFEIIVKTGGPFKNKRELRGKLLERTFDELMITQSGRKVRIPLALVDEVRLPPALVEAGDIGY